MHIQHWQDLVLAVSVAAFNIALIPSVISSHKPAIHTSLLTAAFLIPMVVVYVSLSLWYSVIMTSINAALWLTLLVQKYVQSKSN